MPGFSPLASVPVASVALLNLANGAVTEQNDRVTASGSVAISGSAALFSAPDAAAGLLSVAASLSGAIAEQKDTAAGAASVLITGTAGITEAADIAVGSASRYSGFVAFANLLEANDVASGTANVTGLAASGSLVEADDTASGQALLSAYTLVIGSGAILGSDDIGQGVATLAPLPPEIGTADEIVNRVKHLIPNRWFSYAAPIRDAILGGIADGAAWCYSLIRYTRRQIRIASASGPWLDLIAFDYFQRKLKRSPNQADDAFRARIQAELLRERVTREGMVRAIKDLTGKEPWIFEPWHPKDTGAWQTPVSKFAWNRGGGWGSMNLPAQTFMTVYRPGLQGIPRVGGWGSSASSWNGTGTEWVDLSMVGGPVTDADIVQTIVNTKPTGSKIWVRLR
jgi:hypothetical protein